MEVVAAILITLLMVDSVSLSRKVKELEKRINELPDLIAREKKAGRYQ